MVVDITKIILQLSNFILSGMVILKGGNVSHVLESACVLLLFYS